MRVATLPVMQNGGDTRSPAAFTESRVKAIIWLFCMLAAIRVFVFCAAFPFFNNVDEPAQFDLVLKYSHGHVPGEMEAISSESGIYLAVLNSRAYYGTPDKFPDDKMPLPLWTEPPERMKQDAAADSAGWQKLPNYEASQAPLYYVPAGLWWNLGNEMGLHDGRLVYWLRFLNVLLMVAAVWLGYIAAKVVFPENLFLKLGVPALITFMPQTAFYSIGNDALSPVCFGLAFIFVIKWLRSESPSLWDGAAMGLAFAATWLTKATNLSLLVVAGLAVLIKTWQLVSEGKRKTIMGPFMAFIGCAVLPAMAWAIHCKKNFGDFSGAKAKTDFFGWTFKPFPEWWHHPIFLPSGIWTYLSGQLTTFWQGEFLWHSKPMLLPGSAFVYTVFSMGLLLVTSTTLAQRSSTITLPQRQALALSIACFVAALGFFALMSIIYDFHDSPNPTRDHPYFQAGRMFLGALIPFMLMLVYGLDRLLKRFGNAAKFFALAGIILAMLVTEVATDWPAFTSPFNWYHLP